MENTTKLTKQLYASFLRRHSKISFIIIRICYSIIVLSGILSLTVGLIYNDIDYATITYCGVMALIFILYDIFFVQINLWIIKDKKMIDSNYNYRFNEDDFEVNLDKNGIIIASEKLNYSLVYKVVFYDDSFYIYINRINAFIVDKNSFKTVEDYQNTLKILLPYANNNKKKK